MRESSLTENDMKFSLDKLIINLYALLLAIGFIYLYQHFFSLPVNDRLYVQAGLAGVIYVLAGCLVCVVPVGTALGVSENSSRDIFFRLLWLQGGRFFSLMAYALAGELVFAVVRKFLGINIILASLLMAAFGLMVLFRKQAMPKSGTRNIFYFLWGVFLGYGCSVEATGFLIPLWLHAGGFAGKVISFVIFSSVSVFLPLAFLALVVRIKKGVHLPIAAATTVHRSAGLFLVLLGITVFLEYFPWEG